MSTKKQTLWTRDFTVAIAATFFTGIVMGILDTCLAPFANDMFASKTLGGYLTSVFNLGSIIMAFFTGRFVDRQGRKKIFFIGTVLFALPTFLCGIMPTPAISLFTRFVQGLGKALTTVAAASMVADIVPQERLGEGMSLYGLGSTMARAFGPSIGLSISENYGYNVMFLVSAAVYLLAGIVIFFSNYESKSEYKALAEARRKAEKEASDAGNAEYKGVWKLIEKRAFLPSINYTIYFASVAALMIFNATFSSEVLGLTSGQIGTFYIVSSVTIVVGRMFMGPLCDKNALYSLIPSYIFMFLMYIVLMNFCVGNYFMYLVAACLYGLATCVAMATYNSIAIVDSPKGRNGAANAVFYFLMDAGMMVASASLGPLIDAMDSPIRGYNTAFIISMAVGALSLVMTLVCFGNKARAKRRAKYGIE